MDVDAPAIDRALVERDAGILADLLAPAIEARLETLRSVPIIGPRLLSLLRGSPRSMTYDALASALALGDDDLARLVDLAARELGAWRGALAPVTREEAEAARPAWERLAGAVR